MIEAKPTLRIFKEAKRCEGSYDDFPTMLDSRDFMVHLSRARVPQPCFMASNGDQVLVVMAGRGHIILASPKQSEHQLSVGDAMYLPAGVASRVVPIDEMLLVRYKAQPRGWEAAIWFCEDCGAEVHHREFDTSEVVSQAGFWQACQEFNEEPALRTCPQCQNVHPAADLEDIRWADVAAYLDARENQPAEVSS